MQFNSLKIKFVELRAALYTHGGVVAESHAFFFPSLCSRTNSESLLYIGLNLVTVALESGRQNLCAFPSLAQLVQDALSRNLFTVSSHTKYGADLCNKQHRFGYVLYIILASRNTCALHTSACTRRRFL